jgi:uncharacterized integral membrane protein (TIGR00698 family)
MSLHKSLAALPGLALCAVLGFLGAFLGRLLPVVGAAIFALALGILARLVLGPAKGGLASLSPGIGLASKPVLQIAVVLLGAKLSLGTIAQVGSQSLLVMLGSLGAAFLVAGLAGRALGVERRLAVLVGTGTAICGGSAIAAAAPVIGAEDSDTTYAFSVIFAFNLAAVFLFPALGRLFGLSDTGFGLWAGTAINDTSSVVAASYAWSQAAGDYAVIVKLTRTLMIIPVTLVLGWLAGRGHFDQAGAAGPDSPAAGAVPSPRPARARLPWFIVAFLGASLLRTLGIIPEGLGKALAEAGVLLIAVALAGIGLSTDLGRIARTGWRPLVLGLLVWAAVAASSLFLGSLV